MMALARSAQPSPSGGLLAWWLGELRELLPSRWRQPTRRRQTLVLQLERPFLRVHERRGRRLEPVGSLLLPETEGESLPRPRRASSAATVKRAGLSPQEISAPVSRQYRSRKIILR